MRTSLPCLLLVAARCSCPHTLMPSAATWLGCASCWTSRTWQVCCQCVREQWLQAAASSAVSQHCAAAAHCCMCMQARWAACTCCRCIRPPATEALRRSTTRRWTRRMVRAGAWQQCQRAHAACGCDAAGRTLLLWRRLLGGRARAGRQLPGVLLSAHASACVQLAALQSKQCARPHQQLAPIHPHALLPASAPAHNKLTSCAWR